MKIFIYIGSLTDGGAERVTVSLAEYLAVNDCSVILATMYGIENDFFQTSRRIKRLSLNLAFKNKGLKKITENIKRISALRKVIKSENPDIVLGMMNCNAVMCIIASLGLNTKIIASERNHPEFQELPAVWFFLRKIFYRFADMHVVQTKGIAEWLKLNTGAKNISIIPNSVKWPIPSSKKENNELKPENYGKNKKIILAVGSLCPQKGFDLLIKAFAEIKNIPEEYILVIVGSEKAEVKNTREELDRLVEEFKLTEKVFFTGKISNIGEWYQKAEIFVLSSRFEGFPNVLLEAMASGCPSVAFNCKTGPYEIIDDGKNGILLENGNISELSGAISKLIFDRELCGKISNEAVNIRKNFSEDKIMSMWLNLFQKLLHSSC